MFEAYPEGPEDAPANFGATPPKATATTVAPRNDERPYAGPMADGVRSSDPEVPRWGTHPGICVSCANARVVKGAQSVFWMCGLAGTDPRFRRYPALPVISCIGHAPGRPVSTDADEP